MFGRWPRLAAQDFANHIRSGAFVVRGGEERSLVLMKTSAQQSDAPPPRKGMPSPKLEKEAFKQRFLGQFEDPAFRNLDAELANIAEVAWEAYADSRKSPDQPEGEAGSEQVVSHPTPPGEDTERAGES